jgi:hypothetical protein
MKRISVNNSVILVLFLASVLFISSCTTTPGFNFLRSPWTGETPADRIEGITSIKVEGGTVNEPPADSDVTALKIVIGKGTKGVCGCSADVVTSYTCFSGEFAACDGEGGCNCISITDTCDTATSACTGTCSDPSITGYYNNPSCLPQSGFTNNYCCAPIPSPPPPSNDCSYNCRSSCITGEDEVDGDCTTSGYVCCQQSTITCDDALKPTCDSVCTPLVEVTHYRAVCENGSWGCQETSSSPCAYNCIGNRCCDPGAGETCAN